MNISRFLSARKNGADAFSRTELMVVIAIITLIAVLGANYFGKARASAKNISCTENLRVLGTAAQIYTMDSAEKLPFAYIHYSDKQFISWDTLIGTGKNGEEKGLFDHKTLRCPEDVIPAISWTSKPKRRSYAMPNYEMSPMNWPPNRNVKTGPGLHWGIYAKDISSISNLVSASNAIPSVILSMIGAPQKTIFLTEHAYYRNVAYNSSGALIKSSKEHIKNAKEADDAIESLHEGQFNYLMIDGHVEALLPAETMPGALNPTGMNGMWTIKADD
ncbi:MAG: type II secretion system protein [Verrucomicrobiota bacterium]